MEILLINEFRTITEFSELDLKVEWSPQMWHFPVVTTPNREGRMAWNETTREQYRRPMVRYETDLTDAEWSVIEPLIRPPSRMGRPRMLDMREVFNGIQFMLGTGCQWRAIPKCFPPFTSIQNHFYAWCRTCVLERMLDALRALARDLAGRRGTMPERG